MMIMKGIYVEYSCSFKFNIITVYNVSHKKGAAEYVRYLAKS